MLSFQAIQRVAVRMLYDPTFAEAVFAAPHTTLAALALSDDEIQWLTSTDRRAWRLDPMRRSRTLFTLLEEYPASAAHVLSHDEDAQRLDAFFSSPSFHHAIQERLALVTAFADHLSSLEIEGLTPMATLEASVARGRRASATPPPGGDALMLAPGYEVISVPEGSLARYAETLGQLDPDAQSRLQVMLTDGFTLGPLPPLSTTTQETVLLEPGQRGPTLSEIPDALAHLLRAAIEPVPRDVLRDVATALGAEAHEADELIDELRTDGTLH